MNDRRRRYSVWALVALVAACAVNFACPTTALAALGGNASSVLADAQRLHATLLSIPLQQYNIHEITTDNGLRVREFLTRNGIVFAVTWNGPVVPDLQGLLGESYAAYAQALAALKQPGLQRSLRIAFPGLVVESGGHLRAYAGRAYLPALIPTGTPAEELR